MWQSDAKSPKVVKVVGIFTAMGFQKVEKNGQMTEMKVKEGSEVKESLVDDVNNSSNSEEEGAEMDSDGDEEDRAPEAYIQFLFDPELPEVILNEYVIGEIGKFLNFDDLRSLRQVNKVWAAGTTPAFVAKSAIVLRPGKRSEEELEAFEKDTKDLKGITALKILSDDSKFGFEKEAEAFNDILAQLSPSLKSLKLDIISNYLIFLPRATIQFPGLRSLDVSTCYKGSETTRLFHLFYASAPNLVELVVPRLESEVISPLLTENSRNWSIIPNLKSLKMSQYLSSEDLSTLIEFPLTWESLEIKLFPDGGATFPLLGQLFEKNKDCLVNLSLEIYMNLAKLDQQAFGFPATMTFSRLQKLKVLIWDDEEILDFRGGRRVNYSVMFPSLTSLSVLSGYEPDFEFLAKIWAYFFPPQNVFKGLKYLELDNREDYAEFLAEQGIGEISEEWAERMFPNARIEFN